MSLYDVYILWSIDISNVAAIHQFMSTVKATSHVSTSSIRSYLSFSIYSLVDSPVQHISFYRAIVRAISIYVSIYISIAKPHPSPGLTSCGFYRAICTMNGSWSLERHGTVSIVASSFQDGRLNHIYGLSALKKLFLRSMIDRNMISQRRPYHHYPPPPSRRMSFCHRA